MKLCIHVRPRDDGQGWAVDVFDGRRAWSKTHLGERPLNKAEAHRLAHKLRDPKFYTARTKRAVNSEGSLRQRTTSVEACAAGAASDDPREMVRVAFEHWDSIGWPEDKAPLALLRRALERLSC